MFTVIKSPPDSNNPHLTRRKFNMYNLIVFSLTVFKMIKTGGADLNPMFIQNVSNIGMTVDTTNGFDAPAGIVKHPADINTLPQYINITEASELNVVDMDANSFGQCDLNASEGPYTDALTAFPSSEANDYDSTTLEGIDETEEDDLPNLVDAEVEEDIEVTNSGLTELDVAELIKELNQKRDSFETERAEMLSGKIEASQITEESNLPKFASADINAPEQQYFNVTAHQCPRSDVATSSYNQPFFEWSNALVPVNPVEQAPAFLTHGVYTLDLDALVKPHELLFNRPAFDFSSYGQYTEITPVQEAEQLSATYSDALTAYPEADFDNTTAADVITDASSNVTEEETSNESQLTADEIKHNDIKEEVIREANPSTFDNAMKFVSTTASDIYSYVANSMPDLTSRISDKEMYENAQKLAKQNQEENASYEMSSGNNFDEFDFDPAIPARNDKVSEQTSDEVIETPKANASVTNNDQTDETKKLDISNANGANAGKIIPPQAKEETSSSLNLSAYLPNIEMPSLASMAARATNFIAETFPAPAKQADPKLEKAKNQFNEFELQEQLDILANNQTKIIEDQNAAEEEACNSYLDEQDRLAARSPLQAYYEDTAAPFLTSSKQYASETYKGYETYAISKGSEFLNSATTWGANQLNSAIYTYRYHTMPKTVSTYVSAEHDVIQEAHQREQQRRADLGYSGRAMEDYYPAVAPYVEKAQGLYNSAMTNGKQLLDDSITLSTEALTSIKKTADNTIRYYTIPERGLSTYVNAEHNLPKEAFEKEQQRRHDLGYYGRFMEDEYPVISKTVSSHTMPVYNALTVDLPNMVADSINSWFNAAFVGPDFFDEGNYFDSDLEQGNESNNDGIVEEASTSALGKEQQNNEVPAKNDTCPAPTILESISEKEDAPKTQPMCDANSLEAYWAFIAKALEEMLNSQAAKLAASVARIGATFFGTYSVVSAATKPAEQKITHGMTNN